MLASSSSVPQLNGARLFVVLIVGGVAVVVVAIGNVGVVVSSVVVAVADASTELLFALVAHRCCSDVNSYILTS